MFNVLRLGGESLQARTEDPLGTDFHQTIFKRSSECWLLIGHKKYFVLLRSIGEQHLLSSFRVFVHDGYRLAILMVRSPRLCVQGKLLFSTFLDAIGRTISICKSIHLTVWKWPDERRYSGVLPPVLENFRRAISRDPTHCPCVSEDGKRVAFYGC